jgi:tetratricopeptide (TPR) repeat protein
VDLLAIAEAMLHGELAYRRGHFDAAFAHLRQAVALDDALPYDEPWGWMQPTRHALGALLLEQGHLEEAEAVYRADLGLDHTLGTCVEIKYHLMSALSRRPISAMLQTASRIVSVLPGLLDQRLYLFHTPSQRDESEEHSLASAYWQPIVAPYPQSRGGHHSSSFQERPSIAQ